VRVSRIVRNENLYLDNPLIARLEVTLHPATRLLHIQDRIDHAEEGDLVLGGKAFELVENVLLSVELSNLAVRLQVAVEVDAAELSTEDEAATWVEVVDHVPLREELLGYDPAAGNGGVVYALHHADNGVGAAEYRGVCNKVVRGLGAAPVPATVTVVLRLTALPCASTAEVVVVVVEDILS
jgi:hypothetical protein